MVHLGRFLAKRATDNGDLDGDLDELERIWYAAIAPNATDPAAPHHPIQALDSALAPLIQVRRGQLTQTQHINRADIRLLCQDCLGCPLDTLFQRRRW